MKLTRKFTAALMAVMFAVLGLYGTWRLRHEAEDFRHDMQSDHRDLGNALRVSVREVWELDGQARAMALIDRLNEPESSVRIRWVWFDPNASEYYQPKAPLKALLTVIRGNPAFWVDSGDGEAGRFYSYIPVRVANARLGALELSESLSFQLRHIREAVVAIMVAFGVIGVVCGILAWGLGVWLVGKPINRLVDKARRVGEGDFTGPLQVRGRDELAALTCEMNAMSDRLAAANHAVLAEATARLRAMEQLRHADRLMTVGKLASGIAHELGTPLNVVALRGKMIADGEESAEQARRSGRVIVEQSTRMAVIIRQLLDFARPRRAEKAPADLAQVITQTLALLRPLADKHHVTLDFSTGTEPWPAALAAYEVDAGQLQQALTNLVVNGAQAMPRGGRLVVHLSTERLAPPPAEGGGPDAPYACIAVEGAGSGIRAEDLPHLFDPFFTTKDVGEGTGLGLSVSYGMVREHGGWIGVRTTEGRGSTFSIYLPLPTPAGGG